MKTDKEVEEIAELIASLRQKHHYCEDSWYSCPKHEEGCSNDEEGNSCNCGADSYNQKIDEILAKLNGRN